MAEPATQLARQLSKVVADRRVLAAIAEIPRQRFVPADQRPHAYDNTALPIDCGQTISQPLVVARMLELLELRPDDRVLDVGTGSGYHAALLARLTAHVWTIERHAQLTEQARVTIRALGLTNVDFAVGDGYAGWPEQAPFDAINVAAATTVGGLVALEQQLTDGGRLVAPVDAAGDQRLILERRVEGLIERTWLEPVRFVPLVPDESGG
jgi:protein-L-isoaspartate(D-aspartate) O-methyltransferase